MSQQYPSTNPCTSTQLELDSLLLQQNLFSAFFAGASAGMMILDCQLRYVYINRVLAEINGLDAAEHLGKSIHEVIPQLATKLEPLLQGIFDTGKSILDYEISGETLKQPGVLRYWSASYYPLAAEGTILVKSCVKLWQRTVKLSQQVLPKLMKKKFSMV